MYDLDDNPLTNGSLSVFAGGQTQLSVKIDCRAGYGLRVKSAIEDVTVEGKHLLSATWTNLDASAIDLSEFDGSREIFEIRLSCAEISARALHALVLETKAE